MSFLTLAQRQRVGRRIRLARLSSSFPSHDKLALEVGTSRQHLIKLEKGQHLPTDAMLDRIAKATERDVAYFLVDGDEEEEPDPVALMASLMKSVSDASAKQAVAQYIAQMEKVS